MKASELINPETLLLELTKELIDPKLDPMERQPLVKGYARHLEARDKEIRMEELKMVVETFKNNPGDFLESIERRLTELVDDTIPVHNSELVSTTTGDL